MDEGKNNFVMLSRHLAERYRNQYRALESVFTNQEGLQHEAITKSQSRQMAIRIREEML